MDDHQMHNRLRINKHQKQYMNVKQTKMKNFLLLTPYKSLIIFTRSIRHFYFFLAIKGNVEFFYHHNSNEGRINLLVIDNAERKQGYGALLYAIAIKKLLDLDVKK